MPDPRPDSWPDTRRCPNPKVVVTRELADAVMDRMAALFDTTNNHGDAKLSRDQLAAAMDDCDVLVPTVTDDIDARGGAGHAFTGSTPDGT